MFEVRIATTKGTLVNHLVCEQGRCAIGKDPDNLIVLHGWSVGRVHAELVLENDGVHLIDGGSRAGSLVNGQRVQRHGPLGRQDSIEIGGYRLCVPNWQPKDGPPGQVKPVPAPEPPAGETAAGGSLDTPGGGDLPAIDAAVLREWRGRVHAELLKQLDLRRIKVNEMSDEELRALTQELIAEIVANLKGLPAAIAPAALVKQVLDEAVGLGPLEELIEQDGVSEIMVNSAEEIFYEKGGKLFKSAITFTNDRAVLSAIERIVTPLGRRIDESSPMVDARLKDGSRVNAVIPPLALKGPCITIRRFMKHRLGAEDLVRFGALSPAMVRFLETAVRQKRNAVISGGTGSGKTTLLNVLSGFIPDDERIITVEDAAELKLYQPNLVSLEARPPNQEGKGAVMIRDLVKNCLRMRPDRIVVGECRGGEALDMLQAMNTGHDGSLTTAHANTPRDCITRLEVMVMMSGMDLPVLAIREQIASAVNIIVQQTRFSCGSRKVTSIVELTGVESGRVQMAEIFRFEQQGYDRHGKVAGRFIATGQVPEFYEDLARRGIEVDLSIFRDEGGAAA